MKIPACIFQSDLKYLLLFLRYKGSKGQKTPFLKVGQGKWFYTRNLAVVGQPIVMKFKYDDYIH